MSRARIVVAVLAGCIPLIPIAIGLTLSTGGGPAPSTAAARTSPFTAVAVPSRARRPAPVRAGALVADLRRPAELLRSPGGRPYGSLGVRTAFGSPQALLVVRRSGGWLGVLSPLAGNDRVGWIRSAAATLGRVNWTLRISLARRQLTVSDGRRVRQRYRVAIGAPASPTPPGRFAVTDRLATGDPAGPYGCCILALTAVAPHAIQGWSGGNRIAIHSTPETASIGHAVSHGCVRLTLAQGRWLLGHIPLGTPVIIASG